MKHNKNNRKNNLLSAVRKYISWFILYITMSFVLIEVLVKGSEKIASAVDGLFSGETIAFGALIVPFFILIIIGTIVAFVKSYAGSTFSASVQNELKNMTTRKLVRLQYRYFDDKGAGGIMNKLISDVAQIEALFSESIPDFMVVIVTIVTIGIYIFQLDVTLLYVTRVCYPILLWFANVVSKKVMALASNRREMYDKMAEAALDSFNGMIVGRSYNLYETMKKRLGGIIGTILKNEYSRTKVLSFSYVLGFLITWIPRVICYVFALYEVFQGKLTIGELLAFAILLDRIVRPFGEIPSYLNAIREEWVSFLRLDEIMKQPEEVGGTGIFKTEEEDNDVDVPAIEFENISFSYDGERTIFENLNLRIEKGKNTALVGSSGGGKSTVFKILCGFYKPQVGKYRLYGHLYEDWDCKAARKQFALVSQNVFLFPTTIAENVAYGRENATLEEVIEACKGANIHSFIENLPQGYDTYVGERGVKLSGGERQRISIARAFLKKAPILLLDEPTSAVDVATEELIQQALSVISVGKTVITIAHRLSTIQNADNILVFSKGEIAESGTHEELMNAEGVYSGLYRKESADSKVEMGEE